MKHAVKMTLLFVLLCNLSGCVAVEWFLQLFVPPETVKAKYTFPKKKTVLVFVDDPNQHLINTTVKRDLTDDLNSRLRQQMIAQKTISYETFLRKAVSQPDFAYMSIPKVGEAVDADIVLYVKVEHLSLRDDLTQDIWRGRFKVRVKVISVKEGRLWPKSDEKGYDLEEIDTRMKEHTGSQNFAHHLASQLAEQAAEKIAQLFYDHEGKPHDALPDPDPENTI